MYKGRSCWLCGRNGTGDPLDRHHIFGGALRGKSEKLGATVYLCHDRCHENGPKAVHRCRETADALKAWGQRKIMEEQGWTVEQFRAEFGKSWAGETDCRVAPLLAMTEDKDTSSAPAGHLPLEGKAMRDVEDAVPYKAERDGQLVLDLDDTGGFRVIDLEIDFAAAVGL